MDTGAECSLMHHRIYDQLKDKPKLVNKRVCLKSANGSELKCDVLSLGKFVSVEQKNPKPFM